jgi:hypothetical protein
MALTISSPLTEYHDCDTTTGTTGNTLETDLQIEGIGCWAVDTDVETNYQYGTAFGTAQDWSTTKQTVYAWLLCMTANFLDTKANGGIRMAIMDSSSNESYWYVGGEDTYSGGWEVFCFNTAVSPDSNNGTAANLSQVSRVGIGWKGLTKSKLSQNCFVDWIRYGSSTTAALKIIGTNTTTDDGWSEVLSGDSTGIFGIIKPQRNGYILKGPVDIGDDSGTTTTNFTDTGTNIIFDNLPVGSDAFWIDIVGNATGTTDVRLGSVVGTGDDRQGTQGNNISTAGPTWAWDSKTDIAHLDTVKLYGCIFNGAKSGFEMDGMSTVSNSSAISCTWVNCNEVDLGTTSNGAEVLNSFIIDPDGNTNNYGIKYAMTPSAGTMSHNTKNLSFITSGTPTTQYMTHLSYSGDYTITWNNFNFYGSYTSGTLWHGINDGTDADVTISAVGGNPAQSEFSSTDVTGPDTGSVTVSNDVTLTITVKDQNGTLIDGAQTAIYAGATELMNEDTGSPNPSGQAVATYNYVTDTDVVVKVRKSSTGTTRYFNNSTPATIDNNGLTLTVTMQTDTIAST